MTNKFILGMAIGAFLLCACNNEVANKEETVVVKDSILVAIESKVEGIIAAKDSMVMVPSLRYAKEGDQTYTAKMYGVKQVTQWIREEDMSNEKIMGRDYYYDNGQLIFIREQGSVFTETKELYTEKLIYFYEDAIYKAFQKNQFTEGNMFTDTLFSPTDIDLAMYDFEKPYRALQQKGEFTMYFDQFLLIEPQSYLIVENEDKSMNAALYIIQVDSLLDVLYNNPEAYKGQKIWAYHSFQEMNGIERMVYEGAVLITAENN